MRLRRRGADTPAAPPPAEPRVLEEFRIRSVDTEILGRGSGEPAPAFHRQRGIDVAPDPGLFVGDDPATAAAREDFVAAARTAEGFPLGDLTFEDVLVLGHWGFIVDRRRKEVWMGEALGWSLDSVRHQVRADLGGKMLDDHTVLLDPAVFAEPRHASRLHLLSQPGIGIYGHWLVDVVPRLHRLGLGLVPGRTGVHVPKPAAWASDLARRLGMELTGPYAAARGIVRADRVHVQTHVKRRRVPDRLRTGAAWDALAESLAAERVTEDLTSYGEQLFVSRSQWSKGRSLGNHEQVEAYVRSRGFSVVHPQELSLAAQRAIFARARRVVGEDGSGLHNVLYAGPDLHLTVIDLGRTNVFHAGVANVRGQRISHVAAELRDATWELSLDRLAASLDAD